MGEYRSERVIVLSEGSIGHMRATQRKEPCEPRKSVSQKHPLSMAWHKPLDTYIELLLSRSAF